MAFPPEHLRITWSGTLGIAPNFPEIWSFGLNAIVSGFTTDAVLQAIADSAQAQWVQNVAPGIGREARLTRTRVASIGADGLVRKSSTGAYQQADNITIGIGGAPEEGKLFQVALAVSTQSDFPGAVGRGRFFLPVPNLGTLINGAMTPSIRQDTLTRMTAFVQAMNTILGGNGHGPISIASGGSIVKAIPPGMRPVTSLRVGLVPDTIRSRRNALSEAYASLPV